MLIHNVVNKLYIEALRLRLNKKFCEVERIYFFYKNADIFSAASSNISGSLTKAKRT